MTISIHALLAESDTSEVSDRVPLAISIHALLAESDRSPQATMHTWRKVFLSTLSLRRATNSSVNTADQEARFLSTLSLRRATPEKSK